jgi:hypothetical protein
VIGVNVDGVFSGIRAFVRQIVARHQHRLNEVLAAQLRRRGDQRGAAGDGTTTDTSTPVAVTGIP